jgi:hypothetical protein
MSIEVRTVGWDSVPTRSDGGGTESQIAQADSGQSSNLQLIPTRTEQREVPLELASPSAGLKPRTAVEEVVTRLEADLPLPVGRHNLLLIHHHITDGKVSAIGIGMNPEPAK